MTNKEKIDELIKLIKTIKESLDSECCQTLMDADSLSAQIEETLRNIE
tara:strand:+ start:3201 stop:3344 length:144 start_codon:yes stop_codon:yes gene_type:complete